MASLLCIIYEGVFRCDLEMDRDREYFDFDDLDLCELGDFCGMFERSMLFRLMYFSIKF